MDLVCDKLTVMCIKKLISKLPYSFCNKFFPHIYNFPYEDYRIESNDKPCLPVNKATRILDNRKEWRNVMATAYSLGGWH